MIHPGDYYCLYCGKVSSVPFYKNNDYKTGIILKSRRKASSKKDFLAYECEVRKDHVPVPSPLVEVDLSLEIPGIPRAIEVELPNESTPVYMTRACHECGEVLPHFCSDLGRRPIYLILMVGDVAAGKSAWLRSICSSNHLLNLNNFGNYDVKISSIVHPDTNSHVAATNPGGIGESTCLQLLQVGEQGTLEKFADVVLIDASGEGYKNLFQKDAISNSHFLRNTGRSPGVDAIIFFEPATSTEGDRRVVMDVSATTSHWNRIPVACVRTHLDHLIAKQAAKVNGVSLLSKTTFTTLYGYEPFKLKRRFKVQHDVGCQLRSFAYGNVPSPNRRCFLVQSCVCENRGTPNAREDFMHNTNVLDPLLWTLYRLSIFPIP